MIKSLFDEEESEKKEEQPGKAGSVLNLVDEEAADVAAEEQVSGTAKIATESERSESVDPSDTEDSGETPEYSEADIEALLTGIDDELGKTGQASEPEAPAGPEPEKDTAAGEVAGTNVPLFGNLGAQNPNQHNEPAPISKIEAVRNSGLAYSAAIALFGSVMFMLVLGWFADLLFGFAPWGILTGIILGAVIGFFQFFRLTSQIINPKPTDFEKVSLIGREKDVAVPDTTVPDKIKENPEQIVDLNDKGEVPLLEIRDLADEPPSPSDLSGPDTSKPTDG